MVGKSPNVERERRGRKSIIFSPLFHSFPSPIFHILPPSLFPFRYLASRPPGDLILPASDLGKVVM